MPYAAFTSSTYFCVPWAPPWFWAEHHCPLSDTVNVVSIYCSPALWVSQMLKAGGAVGVKTTWAAHHYQLHSWQQQVPSEQTPAAAGFAATRWYWDYEHSSSSLPFSLSNEYNTTRKNNNNNLTDKLPSTALLFRHKFLPARTLWTTEKMVSSPDNIKYQTTC